MEVRLLGEIALLFVQFTWKRNLNEILFCMRQYSRKHPKPPKPPKIQYNVIFLLSCILRHILARISGIRSLVFKLIKCRNVLDLFVNAGNFRFIDGFFLSMGL